MGAAMYGSLTATIVYMPSGHRELKANLDPVLQLWLTWAVRSRHACTLFAGIEMPQGLWRHFSFHAADVAGPRGWMSTDSRVRVTTCSDPIRRERINVNNWKVGVRLE
jgi:hypothetical protein